MRARGCYFRNGEWKIVEYLDTIFLLLRRINEDNMIMTCNHFFYPSSNCLLSVIDDSLLQFDSLHSFQLLLKQLAGFFFVCCPLGYLHWFNFSSVSIKFRRCDEHTTEWEETLIAFSDKIQLNFRKLNPFCVWLLSFCGLSYHSYRWMTVKRTKRSFCPFSTFNRAIRIRQVNNLVT